MTRFSSNYAPLFGSLLTPLVNGIRVAGPFAPEWGDGEPPQLVLIDGEGLGHTPTSAAALSTAVSKRIEVVDAVLLVDNAAQPMQAAPVAAMKAVVTSGNASKLLVTFTHFDMVKGDNLPSVADRQTHVKASVDNILKAVGEDLGPFAERILHQRIERACFFVGGIDETLDVTKKSGRRTIEQMKTLLDVIEHIADEAETTDTRPVYDRSTLSSLFARPRRLSISGGPVSSVSPLHLDTRRNTGLGSRPSPGGSPGGGRTSTTPSSPSVS